jgi:hypothetical protein
MPAFRHLKELLPGIPEDLILPIDEQVKAWKRAKKKMSWSIKNEEFTSIGEPPPLTKDDVDSGFAGIALFFGFGDDGTGHADCVLSGKKAWEYALRRLKRRTWQSPHMDFERLDIIRLRPGSPRRPQGFYLAKINLGEQFTACSVSQMRKTFDSVTGFAHEGFQLLCITHEHLPDLMSERRIPFMALADYDIAPHGFNDFFDVPQLFSSNRILGLGIGNVDFNYQGFGIPTMLIQNKGA